MPVAFMLLICEWPPLTWHVRFVACRVHHWVGALRSFLPQLFGQHLQAQRKPVSMEEVSRSILAGFLCPSVRMSCVFSSQVLPSSSGGQPRAMETPCIVSNAPGNSLPKNSYRVYLQHWDLHLITHVFWGHLIPVTGPGAHISIMLAS